jgi:hypothetical protein
VRDTIYTRALQHAVEAQGGTQALASLLHVPENTLLRWISGRAQTPLQAFYRVIDLLVEHEKRGGEAGGAANQAGPAPQALKFALGGLVARCARCNGTEFTLLPPATTLLYTSELRCRACSTPVTHGALVAELARTAVQHAHSKAAA